MFTGLSAFPLSPFTQEKLDLVAYEKIISRLVDAKVDSICTMGSTGLYPYLNDTEVSLLVKKTVELSTGIPVMAGIGALRLSDVLTKLEIAQQAGVNAVLLAPVSYHRLHDEEVLSLYSKVNDELSVPLCIYENPGTTNFTFSKELYIELCQLPNIAAIKIPGMPFAEKHGASMLSELRSIVPKHIAIGVSGDKFGARGMAAGCDLWLSVIGGLFPNTVKKIMALVEEGKHQQATEYSDSLSELWNMFVINKGGMRVMASAANILGLTTHDCLPDPLQLLNKKSTEQLRSLISALDLK
jgi:4-hydroxy-tetrahydrodipicolinate synthase